MPFFFGSLSGIPIAWRICNLANAANQAMFFQSLVDHTPTFQPAIIMADDGMEISHLLKQNFQWMTSWYFQDNKLVLHAIFYTSWNGLLSDDKIMVMPVSCYDNWVSNLFCLNCRWSNLQGSPAGVWTRCSCSSVPLAHSPVRNCLTITIWFFQG